jgi:hypothetical protein
MSALRYLLITLSAAGACFVGADAMITGLKALNLVILTALTLNAIYLLLIKPPGHPGSDLSVLEWIRKRRRRRSQSN